MSASLVLPATPQPPPMFRNVILDWSGTLCNDSAAGPGHHQSYPPALRPGTGQRAGLPCGVPASVRLLLRKAGASGHARRTGRRCFAFIFRSRSWCLSRFATPETSCLPGNGRGAASSILSAATAVHFHEQADRLGFGGLFEHLYLGVRDKREVIQGILRKHGLDPEETCFIGDMEHDVLAARHGGVTSIAVLTGYDSCVQIGAGAARLDGP